MPYQELMSHHRHFQHLFAAAVVAAAAACKYIYTYKILNKQFKMNLFQT